jgi:hypothetical protein
MGAVPDNKAIWAGVQELHVALKVLPALHTTVDVGARHNRYLFVGWNR